ncbi:MAG: hypothetical protein ACPIA7_02305 [Akkermansiaceae bacterium]
MAFLLGVTFLSVIVGLLLNRFVTKEFLEQTIEESINAEIVIGAVDVSLFALPATVVISEVYLMPRGVNDPSEAELHVSELSLGIGLLGLLQKHIDVTHIGVHEADIKMTYYQDGSTSIGKLFESPDREGEDAKDLSKSQGGVEQGFNIKEQGEFVASLGGLSISDTRIELILEGMGMRLICEDLDIDLSAIKIDPNDLASSNEAQLQANSLIRLYSQKGEHHGDLDIDGAASAHLFNLATGKLEPEVDGIFNLSDQSWLNTRMPFVSRAWEQLSVLEKVGLGVGKAPDRASFGRSKSIAAHYHQGRIDLLKALSIWVADWEVAILGGGWLNTQTNQHQVRGELMASQKASALMLATIFKGLELLPNQVRPSVTEDISENLTRDDRLLVKIKSVGSFADPKIRPDGKIVDISKATRSAAEELLKEKAGDLLKGLLR